MKILFVASESQLIGIGGGVTHTRGILSLLDSIGDVTLHRLDLPLPFGRFPQNIRRARALAKSVFSRHPSKTHYLLGRGAIKRFRQLLDSQAFEIVVLNGADLLPLADNLAHGSKCILISHNIETEIIRGQTAQLRVPAFVKRLLQRDIEKTRNMETDGARQMALVIAISHEDAVSYRRLLSDAQVVTIPGAFAYEPYQGARPAVSRPLRVAYVAKMSWWPNRQGAEWFMNFVLPALPNGTVETHFFGPGSEEFDGRKPKLRGHGFVDSLDEVWNSASFTLCPILGGSGINVKLIESLYNRVPVLATPHACRGLPPINDPALAVVPPEDWSAFLRSDSAMLLASATVRKETVALFTASRQVEILAPILAALPAQNR